MNARPVAVVAAVVTGLAVLYTAGLLLGMLVQGNRGARRQAKGAQERILPVGQSHTLHSLQHLHPVVFRSS